MGPRILRGVRAAQNQTAGAGPRRTLPGSHRCQASSTGSLAQARRALDSWRRRAAQTGFTPQIKPMPGQGRRVKSGGARSKLWPTVTLQVAASSGAAASADPALQPPEAMPPPPPEPPITLAALEARVGNMFPDEGECPQRSGCLGRWRSSTLKLIVAALVAVDSFWEACSARE